MKITLIIFLLTGFTLTAYAQTPKHTETVVLNGMDTYYEVYGEGLPLLFLHGGQQSSALWHEYVNDFADNFEVYLVDIIGHGRSSPLQDVFSNQTAAGQLRDLFEHLGVKQFSGIGFSTGAGVLGYFAVANPGRIDRMIIVGVGRSYKSRNLDKPFEKLTPERLMRLRAIHVHGDDQIRALVEDMNVDAYLTDEDAKKISAETLIVVGELDRTVGGNITRRLDVVFQLHEILPKSHLWIVPNEGHRTFDGPGKPEFVRIANEFLSGKWE
jgi:pimeloyl-ACP methyl ester carboxylesterase